MKNILLEYSPIIRLLMSYQLLLRALANCETQYKIISRQIDETGADFLEKRLLSFPGRVGYNGGRITGSGGGT